MLQSESNNDWVGADFSERELYLTILIILNFTHIHTSAYCLFFNYYNTVIFKINFNRLFCNCCDTDIFIISNINKIFYSIFYVAVWLYFDARVFLLREILYKNTETREYLKTYVKVNENIISAINLVSLYVT